LKLLLKIGPCDGSGHCFDGLSAFYRRANQQWVCTGFARIGVG